MMTYSKLITRADDFGVTPGTNDAILKCIKAGWIKNVGVMAPGPYLSHRIDELIALQDQVCIGVHGTLTSEWQDLRWGTVGKPNEFSSLMRPEDQSFYPDTKGLAQHGTLDHMIAELHEQISKIRELGLHPQYFDSHMNFTKIDGLSPRLATLCNEEDLYYTHTDAHGRFFLSLSQQHVPTEQEWRTATETYHQDFGERSAVLVLHPALKEASTFFPTDVIQARHYEATHLIHHAQDLSQLAQKFDWQASGYL